LASPAEIIKKAREKIKQHVKTKSHLRLSLLPIRLRPSAAGIAPKMKTKTNHRSGIKVVKPATVAVYMNKARKQKLHSIENFTWLAFFDLNQSRQPTIAKNHNK
jgi:hypothetical protein